MYLLLEKFCQGGLAIFCEALTTVGDKEHFMKTIKTIYRVTSLEKLVEYTQALQIGKPWFKSSTDTYKLGGLFWQPNISAYIKVQWHLLQQYATEIK